MAILFNVNALHHRSKRKHKKEISFLHASCFGLSEAIAYLKSAYLSASVLFFDDGSNIQKQNRHQSEGREVLTDQAGGVCQCRKSPFTKNVKASLNNIIEHNHNIQISRNFFYIQ